MLERPKSVSPGGAVLERQRYRKFHLHLWHCAWTATNFTSSQLDLEFLAHYGTRNFRSRIFSRRISHRRRCRARLEEKVAAEAAFDREIVPSESRTYSRILIWIRAFE
ncbi:hypothetical protein GWI33_014253 [Rhynchophorus ferrugineus]|uniref:Uncharacterized protein n=1 Tax=Rhynchophorus ferrugineus TaxID=354439 RepID=A0A834I1T9_RHYFE|nr:hypothetical protein GWI33_014253 [Rhynchophorus ferrugineus]